MFGWIVGQADGFSRLGEGGTGRWCGGCGHHAICCRGRLNIRRGYLHTHLDVPASRQGYKSHQDEDQGTSQYQYTIVKQSGLPCLMALTFHGLQELLKYALAGLGSGTFQVWVDGWTFTHCAWFDAEAWTLGQFASGQAGE